MAAADHGMTGQSGRPFPHKLKQKEGTPMKLRRPVATAAALLLALSLAACAGGEESAEEVLERAQAAMEDVTSLHYTMDMEMAFTTEGETVEIATAAEADCITEPLAIDMDMSMTMLGLFDTDLKFYVLQDGDTYTTYTGIENEDGTTTWSRDVLEDLGDMAQYDGRTSMALYLENGTQFKKTGTEEAAGVTADRYDGVITQDSLDAVLNATGALDRLEAMSGEDMRGLLGQMGNLPVSIWIDPAAGLPVKYALDMTEMMQNLLAKAKTEDSAAPGDDLTVDQCSVVMLCSNYNAVAPVQVPQEALDAPTSEELADEFFADADFVEEAG